MKGAAGGSEVSQLLCPVTHSLSSRPSLEVAGLGVKLSHLILCSKLVTNVCCYQQWGRGVDGEASHLHRYVCGLLIRWIHQVLSANYALSGNTCGSWWFTVVLNTPSVKPPVCQALVIQKQRSKCEVGCFSMELILAVLWLPAAVSPTLVAVTLVAVDSGVFF